MQIRAYRAASAGATVLRTDQARATKDVLLDAETATAKLAADAVRQRRKPTRFAQGYAEVLRAFGTNFCDWGTGTDDGPRYVTTNDQWNHWKLFGDGFPPKRLAAWRFDHHTRLGRTSYEKLYVTTGGLSGLALGMLDVDGHHNEPDVREAYRWAADTYFGGDLYDEASDNGHHGYVVWDRSEATDAAFNDLAHLAHLGLAALGQVQNFKAALEIKARITHFDRRGCVTMRGGLFAVPNLTDGDESLDRFAGSTVHSLSTLERIIRDADKLPVNRTIVQVRQFGGEEKVMPRRRGAGVFTATTTDPRDLKVEVVQWLARQHSRLPTLAEALAVYNLLRDHPCDPVRERKMQAAIDFVGRTFNPAKCRESIGESWEARRGLLVALVNQHVTPEAYDRAGIPGKRRNFTSIELAIGLHSLEVKSFTKEPKPKQQFTWGVDFIEGVFRDVAGKALKRQRTSDLRKVLGATPLAECFDYQYRPSCGFADGISRKYHLGTGHPDFARFCRWAEDHGVLTVKFADLVATETTKSAPQDPEEQEGEKKKT